MNKSVFLTVANQHLHQLGYKRNQNYWYLANGEIVFCVFVQGSQWDQNDYYVEVGIALQKIAGCKPSLTHWYVRKRCTDENNRDLNISLPDLIKGMKFFERVSTEADLKQFIAETPHVKIGMQYELLL